MQENKCFWVETREGTLGMELVVKYWDVECDPDKVEIWVEITGREGIHICHHEEVLQGKEMIIQCPEVELWDSEHPCLYKLNLKAMQEGKIVLEQEKQIGFRILEKAGKQLLWNHKALKLKGIGYRERLGDLEGTRKDLELFAKANINFIRSMYYPFSEEFLQICDEMGFFVEDTAPFYEVGQAKAATQDLPHCKKNFIEPVQKMLMESGGHVSVLIWSLGHDCAWGSNFRKAAELVRSVDNIRPLTFHLPMSIPEEEQQMDVWPVHYVDWKQPFDICFDQMVVFHTPGTENEIGYKTGQAEYQVPVLHEIWSPVPCHNRDEIEKDYSIREFWGESILRFAEKSYRTSGCLGGAVLAGVDEDGSFEGMKSYNWGILDNNHIPKPEYKHLAKAYAPVKIHSCDWVENQLKIRVENRFLFTDLSECTIMLNGRKCENLILEGMPGCSKEYIIPAKLCEKYIDKMQSVIEVAVMWKGREICEKKVKWKENIIDKEDNEKKMNEGLEREQNLTIAYDEKGNLVVEGGQIRYCFDKETCLLQSASIDGITVLKGGPWLNTTGFLKGNWTGKNIKAVESEENISVTIWGNYKDTLDIRYDLLIKQDGTLCTFYEIEKLYRHMPHRVKADVGLSALGLNEKGISYLLAEDIEHFYIERQGEEVGLKEEVIIETNENSDKKDKWGSLYHVNCLKGINANGNGIKVEGEKIPSVRLERTPVYQAEAIVSDRDARMKFEGTWYPVNDYCGNYAGTEMVSRTAGDTMKLTFTGTGISLYGAVDMNYGMCSVSLDGQIISKEVSQYPEKVDFPGMSRGYEKRYGQLIAKIENLEEAEHVLTVTVLGKSVPQAQNMYTSIDYAVLEGKAYPKGTILHINQAYNYSRLVRGCYKNPNVYLVEGVKEGFTMKLIGKTISHDMKKESKSEKSENLAEPAVPRLVQKPLWSQVSQQPVVCLDGEWELVTEDGKNNQKIIVPFDTEVLRKRGFPEIYEYRKTIKVPKATEDARVVLSFEGVNAFAEVYVDDVYVASHKNGFLTWNVEITEQIRGKEEIELVIKADEKSDKVSAYSHGGILHSVYLYILPHVYVDAMYLSPLFDEDMETCTLRVDLGLSQIQKNNHMEAEFRLYGPICMTAEGFIGDDKKPKFTVRKSLNACIDDYYTYSFPVENAVLWDAEHPNLYILTVDLFCDGIHTETISRRIGLRRLTRKGNRLFVNQKEVKLRGVCRHEISPENGRALNKELIQLDVLRFKEANCNYIRTSHYPPSSYFLDLCDIYGIYVEDELALAFIARTLPYTQRDPEETQRYISHFTECLARDYNHPSVIIWSLCNESFGGSNFDILNRYVHKKDPTRFTKFSYPMTIREEHELPDIWSIHYSEHDTDLAKKRDNVSVGYAPGRDLPVLHDEYVHVCCYNREEMRRDPAVHSFWGESIRIFWDNIWNTEGTLGGAIWAGIDETDVYCGGNTRLEWGIIDVWRRKKPEFYMTRKAYSPVKILHGEWREDGQILLVVQNRFCHTDLSEVSMQWKMGNKQGMSVLPKAKPGMTVRTMIDIGEIVPEDGYVHISFMDANGFCVDELRLFEQKNEKKLFTDLWQENETIDNERKINLIENNHSQIQIIKEQKDSTILLGENFRMLFSNETGLMEELIFDGTKILSGGPWLNTPYLKLGTWKMNSFVVQEKQMKDESDYCAEIVTVGEYKDSLTVEWRIFVKANGEFCTKYRILHVNKYLPKALKLRVGVDCGGLDELGIAYLAAPGLDIFSWKKKLGLYDDANYTWYPSDHISRNIGTAKRIPMDSLWDRMPQISWSNDVKRHILNGKYDVVYTGSNDFRSTREKISEACLYNEAGIGIGIRSLEKQLNVRLEVQDPEQFKIPCYDKRVEYTGVWYKQEDKKQSDSGIEMWSHERGAKATVSFHGNGIVWYGPQDTVLGMANVYVDGVLAAEKISQRSAGCDFSCGSVGYDKLYHIPIFSVTGLPTGEHSICIEVCGEKQADSGDCYIILDYFRVLTDDNQEQVKILLNQATAYPHISWGNYSRPPILLKENMEGEACMKAISVDREFLQKEIMKES